MGSPGVSRPGCVSPVLFLPEGTKDLNLSLKLNLLR